MPAQLGSTVTFDLPPRVTAARSLVAQFQPADQRVQSLTVNNQYSASIAFTSQQEIFNAEQYMGRWGKSMVAELGAQIEADIASLCVTAPYRFYGDGVTPINSYGQLAQMIANFEDYGSVTKDLKVVLSTLMIPQIINSGQNQFTLDRNNKTANSWELGEFGGAQYYKSNLLPVHIAGSAGVNAATLTVISTVLDSSGAVTAITALVSGSPGVDANSIKQYDKLQFKDGVSGFPNLRYLTFIGHKVSGNPVQIQATADAASDGSSHVTFSVYPPLQALSTNAQNLNAPIVAGMQLSVLPSHRAGIVTSGNSLYLAMPKLPNQSPFTTVSDSDPLTGASLRHTEGAAFGLNQLGTVIDAITGFTQVPEYSMSVIIPV